MGIQAAGENPHRRPKGDKRDRTRAKLLDAARSLVREQGYERTTLHDVAARAGMTSGAIYGNFKNREELFLALGQTQWAPIKPKFRHGSSFAEQMRAWAAAVIASIPERRTMAFGRLTGLAYTLDRDEMRAQIREATAQSYALGAQWLRGMAAQDELPMPPDTLVRVLHALTEGLLIQRFLTPDLVPDEVFYAAFESLARPRLP
jgi:AcrR family transcriptional regulator